MFTDNRLLENVSKGLLVVLLLIGQLAPLSAQTGQQPPKSPLPPQQTLPARSRLTPITGPGATAAAAPLTPGAKTYSARFDTDLFVQEDIQMRGVASGYKINFVRPRGWEVLPGSQIRLQMEHSAALIGELSFLDISINDTKVMTVRLDETNVRTNEILVDMKPEMLQDYNTIGLSVAQHYTRDCEDPFHSSLWTTISRLSDIYFVYKPNPQVPDLSTFPSPFYDQLHYGPTKLHYLMPQSPSQSTLTSLVMMNTSLAQAVAWHHMETSFISSLEEAQYPTIIVGTPTEQPIVNQLLAGKSISSGAIQVMQHPINPLIPVLVVTGSNPEGVMMAAKTLTQERERRTLNGPYAVVSSVKDAEPSREHDWPGYIPATENGEFTLAQLGYKDQTARGFFSGPIIMNFKSIPDYKFVPRSQQMTLRYSYSAQLDPNLSTVEIRIDDIAIRSLPLNNEQGENRLESTFHIPQGLIHPNSKLVVVFHLFPIKYDPCKLIEDKQIWGTIHEDTSFSMPRDYYADLPDLEAFRNGGFPFTRYQDMQDTVYVVPDSPTPNELQMMMDVSTRLGRISKADHVSPRVYTTGSLPANVRDGNNLIVIGTAGRQRLFQQIAEAKADSITYKIMPGEKKQLRVSDDPKLEASDFVNQGVMEEMISPWNNQKVILAITGREETAMMNIQQVLRDDKRFSGLNGNLILAQADGSYNPVYSVSQRQRVGTLPWWREWQLKARDHWVLMLTVVLLLVFIVFSIARASLVRYRESRRRSADYPLSVT